MSLPQTISGLWEPASLIAVTRDDMQEIRAEASRCLLVHQVRIFEAKQKLSWNSEDLAEAATQLLGLLLERPDRKIIRLVYLFAEKLNMVPMETVYYALNTWRASTAHFSEDAHYIEGGREISAMGTNAILLATLDWRPGPAVRPWLRGFMKVVNAASAALAATLTILRCRGSGEGAPFGALKLVNVHEENLKGLQMFLRATLDTIWRSQIDRGINAGQELGLILGVNTHFSKDFCLWTLQNGEKETFNPACLLHPALKALGSPWRKFCLLHGIGNEFIGSSIPPCLGMLEFRVPGVLDRMYSRKRFSYMWLRIKYRQLNRGVRDRPGKGTVSLFKHLARQTSLPYSNVSDAAVTPAQEMEIPFDNYDMTHQPITDTKGFLSFPFMTSVVKALGTQEEGQHNAEEDEEVTIDYTHYLVNPSSAFQ